MIWLTHPSRMPSFNSSFEDLVAHEHAAIETAKTHLSMNLLRNVHDDALLAVSYL
jgi:hypothetical protein